jgi:hypothetical protein
MSGSKTDEEYVEQLEAQVEALESYAIFEYEQRIEFLRTTLAEIVQDIETQYQDYHASVQNMINAKTPGSVSKEAIQEQMAKHMSTALESRMKRIAGRIRNICSNLEKPPPTKDELRKRSGNED